MAGKSNKSGTKKVTQKRVAIVLASLVGTLTVSSMLLLAMSPTGFVGNTPMAAAVNRAGIERLIKPASPLQPNAWNYIIIYESADLSASAQSLAEGRVIGGAPQEQRMRPRADFHFVIKNGQVSRTQPDGDLEVTAAWQNQKPGAPYAGWPDQRYHHYLPYKNVVGVCLAADLKKEPVSEAQHRTLVQLVKELQQQLGVSSDRVFFQWQLEPNVGKVSPAQQAYADSFRQALK